MAARTPRATAAPKPAPRPAAPARNPQKDEEQATAPAPVSAPTPAETEAHNGMLDRATVSKWQTLFQVQETGKLSDSESDPLLRAVQRRLNRLDAPIPVTGRLDRRTIVRLQEHLGQETTGELKGRNDPTIKALQVRLADNMF